jgi:hypothetical protein
MNKTEIQNISLEQAISFRLIQETVLEENNYGHVTFRIEKPEKIKNNKIEAASILLFTYVQSVTSYRMSEYKINEKDYFSTQINKLVVDSVIVSIVCLDRKHSRPF